MVKKRMPGSGGKRKPKGPLQRTLEGAFAGALCAAAVAALSLSGFLDIIENRIWDMRAKAFAAVSDHTDDIRVVFIDQASLDWAEKELGLPWPWPRELYGSMLSFFTRAGAKVVTFDMLYNSASSWGVEDDAIFAKALRDNGKSVVALALSVDGGDAKSWPDSVPRPDWGKIGIASGSVRRFDTASFPAGEIAAAAAALGNVRSETDTDGINRRFSLVQEFDGVSVPSLGFAAYVLGQGQDGISFVAGGLESRNGFTPLDSGSRLILRFRGPSQTHVTLNAKQVIMSEQAMREGTEPVLDPSVFSSKYVFVGSSAPGLMDLRASPVGSVYPGVEFHATALDNLLSSDGVRELPKPWVFALIMVLGMAAGAAMRLVRDVRKTVAIFVVFLAATVLSAWYATAFALWLPMTGPLLAVLLSLIAVFILNYAGEGRQKRFIKDAFSQYLSPVVIERLVQDPDQLVLGGEKRCLSILFSDIRGFTSISEHLDPVALTGLLNDYLSEVTDIIYRFGGTIDKYEGDAVIAFWNAPLDLPDHALKSVQAALQYQKTLAEIRPRLAETAGRDVYARIGINSGDVVIGNMGSRQRFNYTFLGDAGNLASRLEGINKQFGTFFMVSENTKRLAGEDPSIRYRELSKVTVVGKKEPVTVYEPMYREEWEARAQTLETFDRGLRQYYSGNFVEALDTFKPIKEMDAPAKSYCKRLEDLLKADAPKKDWTGVWDITEK